MMVSTYVSVDISLQHMFVLVIILLIYFEYIFSRHCFAAFHCLHRQIPGWRPSSSRVTWFVNG
jgi:hypothetical protein